MKKQQIKNNPPAFGIPLDKGDNIRMKKAFTLVELIIVITILAVLATIAFVSFSSYTASSRDTKRIVTIESIAKGLNIFQTQTGKYPVIDNQTNTGIINSDTLSFVGQVGDNISRLINISPTPKDPVSGNNYVYATSFDQKYFQVAGTQEKPVADKSIFSQAYANSRQAKVLGNYNGLLKKENKLYNLPSLIYTGSGYLVSNSTYFIVDKGQNIPYKIASTDLDNSVSTSAILTQLTGTSSVVLTGVTIPTSKTDFKNNVGSFIQIFGYNEEKIGNEVLGSEYFVNTSSSLLSKATIIQTDGNFKLFSNGIVKCTGASVGHTGVLNGVTYTAVSNQNLFDMRQSNNISFYETACTSLVTDMNLGNNWTGGAFFSATINPNILHWDVSNVVDMRLMFRNASVFNQDLSSWCVKLNPTKPTGFDEFATGWNPKDGRQPVWGTCPGE